MAYLGAGLDAVNETLSTINMVCDTMTGNGSITTKVLSSPKSPGSVNNVSVYFDGVAQKPTTDYTLANSTITFTTAPTNNVNVVILSYANEFANILSDKTVYSSSIEDGAITNDLISGISASKLTGALPSLDGSALTGVTPIDPVLLNETSNPTVSSMTATGNGVGTLWVNSTTGNMFVCTDATVGANVWINIGEGSGNITTLTPAGVATGFMTATGGTITTNGDFKVHTFLSSGNFQVTSAGGIGLSETLIVAGGGGGGVGGGGAGGYLVGGVLTTLTDQIYSVIVGGGGNKNGAFPINGADSTFAGLRAIGGGNGGYNNQPGNGGSGGGVGHAAGHNKGLATAGQGNNGGGPSPSASTPSGAGGGGAGAVGVDKNGSVSGGDGGAGLANDITGTSTFYAGGGGGGVNGSADGAGGSGIGGNADGTAGPHNGVINTGSGGGGGYQSGTGHGSSGIVIIRYQFQ